MPPPDRDTPKPALVDAERPEAASRGLLRCGRCGLAWRRAEIDEFCPTCGGDLEPAIVKRRRKKISRAKRRRVLRRDGHRCVYCGTHGNLTVDHRVPVAKGGSDDERNLQTMCDECNRRKGSKDTVVDAA